VNRSTLAILGFALALAVGACGRYGPPIRRIDSGTPAPKPAAESAPTPSDQPAGEKTIETFEDEPIP
jgi:hypothetical protein